MNQSRQSAHPLATTARFVRSRDWGTRLSVRAGEITRGQTKMLLLGAWIAASAFVASRLSQGWVPHDDGAFAQSAQRVLDGQLPHREFVELYTGGLTFLNAAVFALLGEDLLWLRVPMFVLFVAYVPCVYGVARRFVPPVAAALTALLAVAWGPPTYPAAVPSWYLLFFTVFGALALIKYLETERTRWLVLAGLFGGLSISVKIVGIWYVLAVLFSLLFVEQQARGRTTRRETGLRLARLLMPIAMLLGLAPVVAMLRSHLGGPELVKLLLPLLALSAVLVWGERTVTAARARERIGAFLRLAAPFLIGVAIPIGVLLVPFVVGGAVDDLLVGVFVSPQSRLGSTYISLPGLATLAYAVPAALALVVRSYAPPRVRRAVDVTGIALLSLLVGTGFDIDSYRPVWHSASELAPLVVVGGAAALALRQSRIEHEDVRRPVVFLLLALAGFSALVQFPFGAPIYFCYIAPIVALAAIASLRDANAIGGLLPVTLLLAYVLFGFAWLDRGAIYFHGLDSSKNPQTVVLDQHRASIRVTPSDRALYGRAVRLLERHSAGRFTFAGPDTPELYFLSGLRNPTRSLFDLLDPSDSARGSQLLDTLRETNVTAIAINLAPTFSDPLASATVAQLRGEYPYHVRVGQIDVRWRTAA